MQQWRVASRIFNLRTCSFWRLFASLDSSFQSMFGQCWVNVQWSVAPAGVSVGLSALHAVAEPVITDRTSYIILLKAAHDNKCVSFFEVV